MRTAAVCATFFLLCPALVAHAYGANTSKRQLWGTIAYHSGNGTYGFAVDQKTKRDAEAEAVRQCGADCDVIRSFRNACGAIAEQPRHFAWDSGASREIAERKAMTRCGGKDCRIVVWACTTEK